LELVITVTTRNDIRLPSSNPATKGSTSRGQSIAAQADLFQQQCCSIPKPRPLGLISA
jgi:hypothetical protein